VTRVARLLGLAAISGALAGVAAFLLLRSLTWATNTRTSHGWLLWFLPLAGLGIGVIYTYLAGVAVHGTRHAVREGRRVDVGVPARMAPLVLGCAVAGHLFGASVGREGAAVQMSASITDTGARLLKLRHDDRQILLGASLAGGFSAVVGTPFAGFLFAVQLTRRRGLLPVLTCAVAAAAGDVTVRLLDHGTTGYPRLPGPDWTPLLPFKLLVAGVVFGLAGRLYMWSGNRFSQYLAAHIAWKPLRPFVGGLAIVGLAALVGRDYLGLSLPLLGKAIAGSHISWWVPLLKLLFTVIAIGSGFVGGEVIPLFVLGATLGATLAVPLHMSPVVLAACGLATTFTAAAHVGLTGIVIATELFGWRATIPAAIVTIGARIAMGHEGLYVNRHEIADPLVAGPLPNR
jgi:H+/Cl- antiporter ClcA